MSFFTFRAKDIAGKVINFDIFNKAKCFLIVNVASQCGLTNSNYRALEKVYEDYHDKGLEILGFPCNQFGAQEPWDEDEICEFVKNQYNVKFPMFSKVDVNGQKTCDLYRYLKDNEQFKNGNKEICQNGQVEDIPWNFAKFLLDRNGKMIKYFGPKVNPDKIRPYIQAQLNK